MGTNLNRARKSLQAISDEPDLMEIIKNAPLQEIRLAAIDRIHSKDRLPALAERNYPSTLAVKAFALDTYIHRLSLSKDEGRLVEKVLKNWGISEAGAAARKKAARPLPKDHVLLDWPCCPNCACVDAVMNYLRLKATPIGYDGFSCTTCGKKVEVNIHNIALKGYPAPLDFSISLRDFSK